MPAIYFSRALRGRRQSAPRLIAASVQTSERVAPVIRRRESETAERRAELRSRGLRAADGEAGGRAGEGRRAQGPGHDREAEPRQAATWEDSREAGSGREGEGALPSCRGRCGRRGDSWGPGDALMDISLWTGA